MRTLVGLVLGSGLLFAVPAPLAGQTATRTQISGRVVDAQRGALPGATVQLRDQETNQTRTLTADAQGQFTFSNLDPSTYELTVTLDQFKTSVIKDIRAEVARAVTRDVMLEVGALAEQVTVTSNQETVLQKEDAAVGLTFDNRRLTLLPSSRRDASQLITLQAASTPLGEIAGARRDQSTFMVDGVDVSEKAFGAPFQLVIPTPVDAVEEFRAAVANANSSFGRSAGGQYTFITRRGTNEFRGSAYEYHQNDGLNANSWTSNRLRLPKANLSDNRFGGSLGGPIVRDRTFFFGLYEGRRLSTAATVTRLVPTASLKQGLLRFADTSGAVQTVDPRTFDPRGIGASSVILDMLRLYPEANDTSAGDGLNTSGFTLNYPLETNDDLGIFRLDHVIGPDWRIDGSIKVFNGDRDTSDQIDLVNQQVASQRPVRPRSLSTGLSNVFGSRMTNELRFGWVRDSDDAVRVTPEPAVAGLNVAVDLAGTLLGEPVDLGRAASGQRQVIDVFQFIDNFSWTFPAHTFQAGFNIRHIAADQIRTNKVIGTITTPTSEIGSATFNVVPASQRPAFLRAADVARYNALYASLLGQVETVGYLATRNSSLEPNPGGTPMLIDSSLNAYEFYVSDTWRLHPSFTVNYGLRYVLQTPPTDPNGLTSLLVYRDSLEVVNPTDYLARKADGARAGQVFNPDLAWMPAEQTGQKMHRTDRNNFSPRVAATWSPSFGDGFLGTLFGEQASVVRGGYALVYDRVNIPTFNTLPALGPAFAQLVSFNAPLNTAGQPFRAGVDGPIPIPAAPLVSSPVTPSKPFGESLALGIDPFVSTPYSHTVDATFQRTAPGNLTIEVGYIGRFGRNLLQGVGLNQVSYFFRDPASGQTFAQAYDALAGQLRGGTAAAGVTPQPWFENLLPNLAPSNGSRTSALAERQTANLITGNLSSLFLGFIDGVAAQPFNNRQVQSIRLASSVGESSYHALFVSTRKRYSNGFTVDVNYTLSRSRDQVGLDQTQANAVPNSYDLNAEYGPSLFDYRHLFNANWVYELPFGEGRRYAADTGGLVGTLISGWYTAGVVRMTSAAPLTVVQSTQVWGGDINFGFNSGAIPTGPIETGLTHGVSGSSGIGTASTGLNIFADPAAAFRSVRPVSLSEDVTSGRGALRGLPFRQVDLTFGKATRLTDRVTLRIGIDLVNAFNTVNFTDPTVDLRTPASFGVVSAQRIDEAASIFPRRIQLSGRIEF
jgi:hypothetical protein